MCLKNGNTKLVFLVTRLLCMLMTHHQGFINISSLSNSVNPDQPTQLWHSNLMLEERKTKQNTKLRNNWLLGSGLFSLTTPQELESDLFDSGWMYGYRHLLTYFLTTGLTSTARGEQDRHHCSVLGSCF